MRDKIFLAALLSAAMALPASALTITNRDADSHTVTVTTASGAETIVLEADETREDLCADGCALSLETGASGEFDAEADVSISEGELTLTE